jgi:Tol biopolymer transport system component
VVYADHAQGGLFVMPFAGGAPRRLTDGANDSATALSRDGARVVFQRSSAADGARIYVVPLDGRAPPRAIAPRGAIFPAVSPVEDRLVYVLAGEGEKRLFAADLDGRGAHPLRADLGEGDWAFPRFSSDGKRLIALRKWTEVVEIPLDPRAPVRTLWKAGEEGLESVDYAPDGDGLIASVAVWDGDLFLAEGKFE